MDTKLINSLRSLSVDMIYNRGLGDAGLTLSLAPTIYTVFTKHMHFVSTDPTWINRDRFILSTPGAAPLLYSILLYSGYNITLEDVKNYGSGKLSVYPELNPSIGIESTTGKNGEGLSLAVGVTLGSKYMQKLLGKELINFYTYTLVTDECISSPVAMESLEVAAKENLNNLIILYNSFETTVDGKKDTSSYTNKLKYLESLGYFVETVTNAEDYTLIDKAITRAKESGKPSIIEIKTMIAIGTSMQASPKGHEYVISENDLALVKEKMSITQVPYHISASSYNEFKNILEKNNTYYNEWVSTYNKIIEVNEEKKKIVSLLEEDNFKMNIKNIKVGFDENMQEDLRETNNNLLNAISSMCPLMINIDLYNKNETKIEFDKDKTIYLGTKYLSGGMIANGMSLLNLKPVIETTLSNSSYMKSSLKMSSIIKKSVSYIFVNDTFIDTSNNKYTEVVNELSDLRSIPNLNVMRSADVNELVGSWDYIINKKIPSALIITKKYKGMLDNSSINEVSKGAYIIKKEKGRLGGVIVSTGNEVELSLRISDELENRGLFTRVVSMPSVNLYLKNEKEYKQELFPVGAKVVAIEMSSDNIWNKFVYSDKYLITLNDYVYSNREREVLEASGFDFDLLLEKIEKLLK